MIFYQPNCFGLDTYQQFGCKFNCKPISEVEDVEIVVDSKKPSDNMDNLHEVQQLKTKILEQQKQIAELTLELEKWRKPKVPIL